MYFWNFESEKFSGEIKIGQAKLMNVHYGQVFQFTFRTLWILIFGITAVWATRSDWKDVGREGYLSS